MDNFDSVVPLLQQLIRIPSVNPDSASAGAAAGEAELARFLCHWLEQRGAEVCLEEIRPGRPNLIARFAPRDGRPRVLFGPHLDTVGVDGMTIPPFSGDLRDGAVHGRGASDTKGPMAAMLVALESMGEALRTMPVAVDFVAFMGEESGQWGSKDFARKHGADYRFAVVGEPTEMRVVNVTKGSLWATLRAHGRAAHSSQPERGENAALKLARALLRLEECAVPSLAGYLHPVLGPSTLNIGLLRAGTRPNIVPDLAEAEIDIRITPELARAGGALEWLHAQIKALALPIEVHNAHENPPMETPAAHPDVEILLAGEPRGACAGAPWFSDAAHLSATGLPSVCMGPGSIDQAHTADEFLRVADLKQGAAGFAAYLRRLAAAG